MLHRTSAFSVVSAILFGALLAAMPTTAAPSKPASKPKGPEIFRTTCVGCHSVAKDGRIPRLDGVRATPEEWDNILRRMGRRGYALSDTERKDAVKEICRFQSLTPDEAAAVSYLAVSPAANLQEKIPGDPDFRQTCVSCHSYAKIASHRRSPDSWEYLHDFHLASFTAALTQSYRDMHWPESAKSETAKLAKSLPFDSAPWKTWQQQRSSASAAGTWVITGHEPLAGDYEATMTFTAKANDDYTFKRDVRYADGRTVSYTGDATLFGGCALRCEWAQDDKKIKASYTIGLPDKGLNGQRVELVGSWQAVHANYLYGQETGSRLRKTASFPTVLRLSPAWVKPGQGKVDITVTTNGPANGLWRPLPADPGVTFVGKRIVDATHVVFTLDISSKAHIGRLPLSLAAATHEGDKYLKMDDFIVVAPGIDYIKATPERAIARLGGITVPKDAVPFEAMAYSNGPDGKRHTDDDIPLGVVPATWTMQEYFNDFDDDDVSHVGVMQPNGLFMPADEKASPKAYNYDNTGNVWVVGTYAQAGQEPLQARAYLNVSAPDIVKLIR